MIWSMYLAVSWTVDKTSTDLYMAAFPGWSGLEGNQKQLRLSQDM